jgi:hypothetical protein
MNENLQEDVLEARLRDDAPYIDDAGFTSGVVQKLPARRVRRSFRAMIFVGITLAACVAAYLLSGGKWFIAEEVTNLAMLPMTTIWVCAGGAALLVMAGGLAAALSKSRGRSR